MGSASTCKPQSDKAVFKRNRELLQVNTDVPKNENGMGLYRQQSVADMPIIQFFGELMEKKQKTNEAWPCGEGASFASGMTATDCNGASRPKHLANGRGK